MRKARTHLNYANLASSLALFLALSGGVAYAAELIGPDDIASDAVQLRHLSDGAVSTAEIADNRVFAADLGTVVTRTGTVPVPPGQSGVAVAACPDGTQRLGGGALFTGQLVGGRGVQASFAAGESGWVAHGRNNTAQQRTLQAQVFCLA